MATESKTQYVKRTAADDLKAGTTAWIAVGAGSLGAGIGCVVAGRECGNYELEQLYGGVLTYVGIYGILVGAGDAYHEHKEKKNREWVERINKGIEQMKKEETNNGNSEQDTIC